VNRIRIGIWTIGICAAVALPLLAAEKLAAKTGLWETTTTLTTAMPKPVIPVVSPEMLAGIPAAQRAQIERALDTISGKPVSASSCVTEKDLEQGAFRRQFEEVVKCTYTVVTASPKRQESTFQCSSPAGIVDGKMMVEVVDAAHVKGTMQIKDQQGLVETKFDSKWISADCGAKK
jgi:hypothetical protein